MQFVTTYSVQFCGTPVVVMVIKKPFKIRTLVPKYLGT